MNRRNQRKGENLHGDKFAEEEEEGLEGWTCIVSPLGVAAMYWTEA